MDACIRKYIAELIGTFVLTFFGCGAAAFIGCNTDAGVLATALAFGLTVMVMSVTVGKISGCHLNPAISLAMFLDKKLDTKDFIGYVVCQIIGALVAGLVIYALFMGIYDASWSDVANYAPGANGLGGVNDSALLGILVEVILTFIFVLIVFGSTSKNSGAINGGLYIGLGLTMVHLVGINLTGTSVNPARSIGLGILASGDPLSQLWVFIVAPLIGGVLAWAVWKFVLSDDADKPAEAVEAPADSQ